MVSLAGRVRRTLIPLIRHVCTASDSGRRFLFGGLSTDADGLYVVGGVIRGSEHFGECQCPLYSASQKPPPCPRQPPGPALSRGSDPSCSDCWGADSPHSEPWVSNRDALVPGES